MRRHSSRRENHHNQKAKLTGIGIMIVHPILTDYAVVWTQTSDVHHLEMQYKT